MAHKTRMNGTNYEIGGGKTLVNGTAYSIDKGKTLVGGTAYEVGFSKMCKIILPSDLLSTSHVYGFVKHDNGYERTAGIYEVPYGTKIYAGIWLGYSRDVQGTIYFNGVDVKGERGDSGGSFSFDYSFEITTDITVTDNGLDEKYRLYVVET